MMRMKAVRILIVESYSFFINKFESKIFTIWYSVF